MVSGGTVATRRRRQPASGRVRSLAALTLAALTLLLPLPLHEDALPQSLPVAAWQRAPPPPVGRPTRTRSAPAIPPLPPQRRLAAVWPRLLAEASQDDPVAACRLALLLDDCRMARDVRGMIETQISMAAQSGRGADGAAAEIAALEESAAPLHRSCGDAPDALVAHGWSFLLRAAIAGHEPSMYRFITDPPLAAEAPDEARAALEAWRTHAGLLLGDLLRRASPQALWLAYRAAQGDAFVADQPLQRRDPVAVLRLGSALALLREDDSTRSVELELIALELTPGQARRARAEGARLARQFLAARPPRLVAGSEECATGWPGMASAWVAYGY